MKNEKQTPALRFRGFDGPWEKKTFSAMAERVSIFTDDSTLPRVEYEDIISGQGRLNKDVYKKNSTKSGIRFSKGQILFGKLRPYLKNWMYASFEGIAVGDFWVLQPTSADGLFLYYLIQSVAFQSVTNQTTGTKMPRADWKIVSKAEFVVPASQEEQHKIGIVLRDFDEKIFAQEQKIKKAEQFRRAMLSKLFPAEGVDEPALRFRGFSGPWKTVQICDIANIVGGGTPDTQEPAFWNGDIDWYAPAEMEGKRYADGSERKITPLGLEKSGAQLLPANRTILFTSRAGIGKMAILKKEGATNQGFQSMVLKDICIPYFIYTMGPFITRMANQVAAGSTFLEISGKALGNLFVSIPSLEEQKKIGDFFEHLDDFLSLQKEKLEKLRRLKAALLEKLFV